MSPQNDPTDPHALNQYRDYLRILATQQIAGRVQGKVDLSGIVQETLWEAHLELDSGAVVPCGQRLPWLRRILSHNLTDSVRQLRTHKRNISREIPLQQVIEQSSMRLEAWLAHEMPPNQAIEHEERVVQLATALARLPAAQRESLALHYWSGLTFAEIASQMGRSREAVAGLIKRGVRDLRLQLGKPEGANDTTQ